MENGYREALIRAFGGPLVGVTAGTSLASLLAADHEKKKAIKRQLQACCDRAGIIGFVEVISGPLSPPSLPAPPAKHMLHCGSLSGLD